MEILGHEILSNGLSMYISLSHCSPADDYMKAAYGLTFDPLEICPTQKSIASQFRQLHGETYVIGTGRP